MDYVIRKGNLPDFLPQLSFFTDVRMGKGKTVFIFFDRKTDEVHLCGFNENYEPWDMSTNQQFFKNITLGGRIQLSTMTPEKLKERIMEQGFIYWDKNGISQNYTPIF
jgi:hypothetical protein